MRWFLGPAEGRATARAVAATTYFIYSILGLCEIPWVGEGHFAA